MKQIEELIDNDEAKKRGIIGSYQDKHLFAVRVGGSILKRLVKVKRAIEKNAGAKLGDEAFAYMVLTRGLEVLEIENGK